MTLPRASLITVDPTGLVNVTATTVQGAVEELDAAIEAGAGGSGLYYGRDTKTPASACTTITLDSTPEVNSELVFKNSSLLAPETDYTISGAVITVTTPLSTSDEVVCQWATTDSTPGSFTFSGTPGSPTVRLSSITYVNSASSQAVDLTGIVAGDLMILFAAHAYAPSTPSGWTQESSLSGANWNGATYSKIATSGDVTAGSVTQSFGGSYKGEVGLVVMTGGTAGIRETLADRASSGTSPISVGPTGTAQATDTALYFGSARTSSSTTSVDRGTQLQLRAADSEAAATIYSEDLASAATVTASFAHTVDLNNGYYDVIVIVKAV